MAKLKGWSNIGTFDGITWEGKMPASGKYIMVRPVGTTPSQNNPDDPHARVDLNSNGQPIWSTLHNNFSGYFGMEEVFKTAIAILNNSLR